MLKPITVVSFLETHASLFPASKARPAQPSPNTTPPIDASAGRHIPQAKSESPSEQLRAWTTHQRRKDTLHRPQHYNIVTCPEWLRNCYPTRALSRPSPSLYQLRLRRGACVRYCGLDPTHIHMHTHALPPPHTLADTLCALFILIRTDAQLLALADEFLREQTEPSMC